MIITAFTIFKQQKSNKKAAKNKSFLMLKSFFVFPIMEL
jgi:hypothetical protein